MSKITKAAGGVGANAVSPEDLAAINRLTLRELSAEEVYTYKVNLCDDQLDRDMERFSLDALQTMAALFVGKTMIFDHQWSAAGQTARIFAAAVVEDGTVHRLQAKAYMLRNDDTKGLIDAIEGGILKEVSVGVSCGSAVCSVCGQSYRDCGHYRGRAYDGKVCTVTLGDVTDVYEASFVAVPAQREAGVTKGASAVSAPDDEAAEQAKRELELSRARARAKLDLARMDC